MRKVTIYSQQGCAGCTMTKKRFHDLGIDYQEKHVDMNDIYLQEVKDLGFKSLPVVVSGDQMWSGFRPDKIKEIA